MQIKISKQVSQTLYYELESGKGGSLTSSSLTNEAITSYLEEKVDEDGSPVKSAVLHTLTEETII